ncbi:MAG: hypothetical protein O7E57_05545 [Gammaproteobacteria bacterium]|nr:hypothetical protein [Gammaproteobacteria bacterium]
MIDRRVLIDERLMGVFNNWQRGVLFTSLEAESQQRITLARERQVSIYLLFSEFRDGTLTDGSFERRWSVEMRG